MNRVWGDSVEMSPVPGRPLKQKPEADFGRLISKLRR